MKAPVKPVGKGGQVAGCVFGEIKCMISPAKAGFEIAQNRINPAELGNLIGFAQADDDGLVATTRGHHPGKAGQPIGKDQAAGGQGRFSPVSQGRAGESWHGDHFGVERMPLGIEGNRRDKRNLVFGTPTGFAAHPFTAQVGVIDQDLAAQRVLGIAFGHRLHELVLNQPGGGIADAQVALQGQR